MILQFRQNLYFSKTYVILWHNPVISECCIITMTIIHLFLYSILILGKQKEQSSDFEMTSNQHLLSKDIRKQNRMNQKNENIYHKETYSQQELFPLHKCKIHPAIKIRCLTTFSSHSNVLLNGLRCITFSIIIL